MNRDCLMYLLVFAIGLADWTSSRAEGDPYSDLWAGFFVTVGMGIAAIVVFDEPKRRPPAHREPPLDSMAYTDNVG